MCPVYYESTDTCPVPELAFGEEGLPGERVPGTAGVMQGRHWEDFLSRPPVWRVILYLSLLLGFGGWFLPSPRLLPLFFFSF